MYHTCPHPYPEPAINHALHQHPLLPLTCRSNSGGLSLTSVISTVKEQTPSKLGSPWSVAFTVTDTNFPSSPSRSNTLFVDTSPVSSSTVNFVPFWFGCCTIEYFTWNRHKLIRDEPTSATAIRHSLDHWHPYPHPWPVLWSRDFRSAHPPPPSDSTFRSP